MEANLIAGTVGRRFAVFAGECYYAKGGLHDYAASFDTISDAVEFATQTTLTHPEVGAEVAEYEWWHVFDMEERKIVRCSEYQGYGTYNEAPRLDT